MYNSSNTEFWPILRKVFLIPDLYKPFVVCICCGRGKPKVIYNHFDQFIDELNQLLREGITIDDVHFEVEIMCFLCDKLARSFCKQVKGYAGYYACERCIAK